MPHFLGIEIGGTKLQLGVGDGHGSGLLAVERRPVDRHRGAERILQQIETVAQELQQRFQLTRVGVGFGGPVRAVEGTVITSNQVAGWNDFPLTDWLRRLTGVPAVMDNDCNVAALAEDRFGAGREGNATFYVTVGTGIGGGFVCNGKLLGSNRPAIAEIGHLRPGLAAVGADQTVESIAAGPGIAQAVATRVRGGEDASEAAQDLLARCGGDLAGLTAEHVAAAAAAGNALAQGVFADTCRTLGWAIAQAVTLLAPEHVVVGGGVSLSGEQMFFAPLRCEVDRYVFPPLRGSYCLVPAELDEQVVVCGAIALAASSQVESS